MKQRLALGLSIVGVLAAGSVAALVNTQILSAGAKSSVGVPTASPSSPIVLTVDPQTGAVTPAATVAESAPATAPTATGWSSLAPSDSVPPPDVPRGGDVAVLQSLDDGTESALTPPTTQVTTTSPANTSTTTTTMAPSATSVSYQVGPAGSVVLETRGDVLRVVSVHPEPGWEVIEAVQESPTEVEITFRSATTRVEFEANLAFGVVMPSVESYHLGPVNSTPGAGTSTVPYDDDHDDDHDDNDHDDDDHDDDEDDDRDDDEEDDD